MTVGDRIKKRRESLDDFSQEKLAKMVGYSGRSSINKIELNKGKVDIDMVETFATALHTSPAYLMGWVDNPELTHEETLQLEAEQNKAFQLIAADTGNTTSSPFVPFYAQTEDKTQKHRNKLAEKIRTSNYTDEQLNDIEQMIKIIAKNTVKE